MIKVLIYWHEYPVCATRIDSLDQSKYDVKVYRASQKFHLEILRIKNLHLSIDYSGLTASSVIKDNPNVDIVLITGWAHKAWIEVAKYYKLTGSKVVMMVDNNLRFTIKQFLGFFLFRMVYSKIPDFYMVPGVAASRLEIFWSRVE